MRRLLLITALLATITLPAAAGGVEVTVQAQGRSPFTYPDGSEIGRVFFVDEPIVVTLNVHYIHQLNARQRDPNQTFTFATRDWTEAVELRIHNRASNIPMPVVRRVTQRGFTRPASHVERREAERFVLRDGEGVWATIELLGLPPGDYVIEGRIGDVSSLPDDRGRIAIRRGHEDIPTTRLFYRYRAEKASKDFRAYETLLRELMAKHEPNNAGILVQIADWSVDKVSPEETVRLYREARALSEANWRAELAKNPNVHELTKRNMAEALDQLTVFERVLPYYRENKNDVRFGSTVVGGKAMYAWFPRRGGLMIDTIDPADPARRRTPDRQK